MLTENSIKYQNNLFMQQAFELDKHYYENNDLGVTFNKDGTINFKVWAPTADDVSLRLYKTGDDNEQGAGDVSISSMTQTKSNGVWSITMPKSVCNLYYTYIVSIGNTTNEVVDIYAKSTGINGKRGMVLNLEDTNPDGWENDNRVLCDHQTDAVIWEVHVKDFSFSPSSGVKDEYRGKYLAFTQTGTTLNGLEGEASTCVDYLKKLGITHVQINPFFDFGSVDEANSEEQYNWGYDPVNYNVPEGSYSTNPYDGAVRVNECKRMIQALHSAGIGVIMDVVYNHTYHSFDSNFNMTVPGYYYRMNSDGSWSNGSGCGCDTASEHRMFRKFMIDSVTYWASEYHLDGFRFDLMGLHDVETMNQVRKSLDKLPNGEKILMYGEGWDMATTTYPNTPMATKRNMGELDRRIAVFNDGVRDALKGNVFDSASKGFLQNGYNINSIITGIEGQSNSFYGWAKAPTQTVTYASCHDNLALYDKLVASCYGNSQYKTRYDNLVSMNKLCGAIVLTSQGIPFFMAGEEFCRSKNGDHNSYKSSPYLNMIDWENIKKYSDVVDYYRNLIRLRKMYRPFRDHTTNSANSIHYSKDVPQGVVAFTLENTVDKNSWKYVALILNGNPHMTDVYLNGENLPSEWIVIANQDIVSLDNIGRVCGNKVTVSANSALIMVGYR